MPSEYRKISERLFPAAGFIPGRGPDLKTIAGFADALGIGTEYQRLLAIDRNSGEVQGFLDSFQNNLDLLIQKTWVEKADERRKEKLQDDVTPLMNMINQGDLYKAIEEFGVILNELAYLFFGVQSGKDDFTEYTFRIDSQIGLFWWYGGRLAMIKNLRDKNGQRDDDVLWAVLLIGLCYLTNF